MSTSVIKILVSETMENKNDRQLLPSISNALKASSFKIHETQLDYLANSLNEIIHNLQIVINEIEKMKSPPSKITFSLGLDGNGEIGILSTVSGAISHGASITVEFDVKKNKRVKGKNET